MAGMSREELRDAMGSWFPCPNCRSTGQMALWPKPRKRSVRQQIAEVEKSIREDEGFLAQISDMLAAEQNPEHAELLRGLKQTSVESLAQQRSSLMQLRRDLALQRKEREIDGEGGVCLPCDGAALQLGSEALVASVCSAS